MTAAHAEPNERKPTAEILEGFLEETDWEPETTLLVSGVLKYSEYRLLKRVVMRRIAGKTSGDTDTARDDDYTDWDELADGLDHVTECQQKRQFRERSAEDA